jgi:hypothetical protein
MILRGLLSCTYEFYHNFSSGYSLHVSLTAGIIDWSMSCLSIKHILKTCRTIDRLVQFIFDSSFYPLYRNSTTDGPAIGGFRYTLFHHECSMTTVAPCYLLAT